MNYRHRVLLAASIGLAVVAPLAAKGVDAIAAAVAGTERPADDIARDADRKPAEILAFARVKPGSKVVELAPGGGYYTRLISLTIGSAGRLYVRSGRFGQPLMTWAGSHGNTSLGVFNATSTGLSPEPVDVVWTTLNYHDFKNTKVGEGDLAGVANRMAFAELKPGGVYLVNDHDAAPGTGTSQTSTLHRIEMAAVVKEVEAAGFKLDAESAVLRHADDDHTLKVVETGIRGKTDQFVLRFIKPRRR